MADVLLATLRPARVLVNDTTIITAGASNDPGTPDGLSDGLNATFAQFQTSGDEVTVGQGTARTEWALDIPQLSADASISKIVVRVRNQALQSDVVAQSLSLNGVTRDALTVERNVIADRSVELTADPADSLPWTIAKLAALSAGWFGSATSSDAFTSALLRTYDFAVEVWGSGTIVAAPKTSYQRLPPPATEYQRTTL